MESAVEGGESPPAVSQPAAAGALPSLPAHTFSPALESLCASFNRLARLPPLPPFPRLLHLDLSHNALTAVAALAPAAPCLRYLNLGFNALASLDCAAGLSRLEELYAHHNRLGEPLRVAAALDEGLDLSTPLHTPLKLRVSGKKRTAPQPRQAWTPRPRATSMSTWAPTWWWHWGQTPSTTSTCTCVPRRRRSL